MLWESRACLPLCWVTVMFFLTKPDGGLRPSGLIVSILRVWGRLRLPLVRAWLRNNNDECFWGSSRGKTRDRAGWVHNLITSYGRSRQMDAATLLLDLQTKL